jgi:hypothetical protein
MVVQPRGPDWIPFSQGGSPTHAAHRLLPPLLCAADPSSQHTATCSSSARIRRLPLRRHPLCRFDLPPLFPHHSQRHLLSYGNPCSFQNGTVGQLHVCTTAGQLTMWGLPIVLVSTSPDAKRLHSSNILSSSPLASCRPFRIRQPDQLPPRLLDHRNCPGQRCRHWAPLRLSDRRSCQRCWHWAPLRLIGQRCPIFR